MATWNREQPATVRLLANNFQEPKWKTVALKNAYALLGKRRFGKISLFRGALYYSNHERQSMLRLSSF